MDYYFSKLVNLSFEDAVSKITDELKKEGFGILTEIDVKTTLKKKLDVDFRNYKIVGSCNPPFAYEALLNERMIGAMLPCNIIVQDAENGKTEVAAVDPIASMQAVQNEKLGKIGHGVRDRFKTVIDNL